MAHILRRMEEIRSRIDEIKQLGKGKGFSVSPAAGKGAESAVAGDSPDSPRLNAFALLLQEAAGLLKNQEDGEEGGLSDALFNSILGLNDEGILSGPGGTGLESVRALLQKTGAVDSVSGLEEGLLSRAIEAYKKQNK